jgi:hypothetical protein
MYNHSKTVTTPYGSNNGGLMMKRMTIPAAALIISAALLLYGGCSSDENPVSGGATMNFVSFEMTGYGPDTLTIYSGVDTCGGIDVNIKVTVPPLEAIWSALIGGGNPMCPCPDPTCVLVMSKAVTTHSQDDSLGVFETMFGLPNGINSPSMHLKVIADDGAEIYLNDYHIGTASLFGGGDTPVVWETTVSIDSLFNYCALCPPGGEPCSCLDELNFLRFELANTGTGEFGEPAGRSVDSVDCMYVQFEAEITWTMAPEVTIDIKPGSDRNPVNCNGKGNGVIPVAILTTDGFDAQAVDCASVRFGPLGAYETHGKCHLEDVDEDGDIDMMLHFRRNETGVACGDTMMVLWGMTLDGFEFEAYDHIDTVPDKYDDGD